MKYLESNPEYQKLQIRIKEFNKINSDLLSSLGLKISLKSTLSCYDQITQILSSKFNIPNEITSSIFDYVSITDLRGKLGASYQQLKYHVRKTGFEAFKDQLSILDGYEVKLITKMDEHVVRKMYTIYSECKMYWYLCNPVYMKLLITVFKSETIGFLLSQEEKNGSVVSSRILKIVIYKRIDLLKILYKTTDAFLNVESVLDRLAIAGNLEML